VKRPLTDFAAQPNLDVSSATHTWSVKFWLACAIVGVLAGLAGGLLMVLLRYVEHTVWNYGSGTLVEAASRDSPWRHMLALLTAGLLVGVVGFAIRKTLGRPGDADAAIWFYSGRVPTLSTLAQALLSIVTVGMGVSLGRESPIKQAGGTLASRLAQWCRFSAGEQRLLVACGVGAGMASAYNVPVGGALFAVEVLLGCLSLRIALPALLSSVVATATSWIFLPAEPIYHVPAFPLTPQLAIWALLAGPLLGLATIPMVRAIDWAQLHKPKRGWPVFIAPVVAMGVLGALSIPFPQLLGNGKDAVQLAFADELSITLLVVLPGLKLLVTCGCLGTGASGGLFTPTMKIGALLGGLLGHGWNLIWPGASMGSCAVIGASAFLAAATQGPISSLVLVLELTRHVDGTMVPMLLAVTGAMLVARRIEVRSIYSMRVHPTDLNIDPATADLISPFEERISTEFTTISAAMSYGQVMQLLLSLPPGTTLYVLGHEGELVGKIDAEVIRTSELGSMPIVAAKASDVLALVDPLRVPLSEPEFRRRLTSAMELELPVVDAKTNHLIGVVQTNVS
jgi:H+/Cl- antiporter ClcA